MAQFTPTVWNSNPDALANVYVYDSASNTYDSANQTYDGVVAANLDTVSTATPTVWSGL